MAQTEVKMKYTPSLNISITTRGGRVDKVTTWVSGVPKSTERLVDNQVTRFNKR